MILVVSCAPKTTPAPTIVEEPEIEVPEEIIVTGDTSVDEVTSDISDASDTDEDLDTSSLGDIDDILADIENI